MRECPACQEALAAMTFDGITVDGCRCCGGVWFDRGELARLAQGNPTQLAAVDRVFETASMTPPSEAHGSCPVCGTALAQFEPPQTPQLLLRGCPGGHGTWLAEEDFEQIAARMEPWRAQQSMSAAPLHPESRRLHDAAHLLLSCSCPMCHQPNATASAICWACGAVLQGNAVAFCCPTCGRGLDSILYHEVPLNPCVACGGLWLDHGELGALVQLTRELLLQLQRRLEPASPAAVPLAAETVPCPTCRRGMGYHEYGMGSGVYVNSCPDCRGVWLDHAALVPIQQFTQANENFTPRRVK